MGFQGLEAFLVQVGVAQVVVHERYEPSVFFDFLKTEDLPIGACEDTLIVER